MIINLKSFLILIMLTILSGCSIFSNKNEVIIEESVPIVVNKNYTFIGKTREEAQKNATTFCSRVRNITPIIYDRDKKLYTYTIQCLNESQHRSRNPLIEAF